MNREKIPEISCLTHSLSLREASKKEKQSEGLGLSQNIVAADDGTTHTRVARVVSFLLQSETTELLLEEFWEECALIAAAAALVLVAVLVGCGG